MKTSLTKRFSIRVKLRGRFVELVIIDSRNGDVYYEQYDLGKAVENGVDATEVKTEVTTSDDSDIPEEGGSK